MNHTRRGILGLFGKAAMAAPFAGTAIALTFDKDSGMFIPPRDVPLIELPPPGETIPDVDYISIPVKYISNYSIEHRHRHINISNFDSPSYQELLVVPGDTSCRMEFYCDSSLAASIYHAFARNYNRR